MKRLTSLLTIVGLFIFLASNVNAQSTPVQHGSKFVDLNGDGFNDNAPDADGDGIPNGQDSDYNGAKAGKNSFVDANGDGINDNAKGKNKSGKGNGNGTKKGSGKGNKGANKGTGTCNGTGQGKIR